MSAQNTPANRSRLRAVYLTDIERDLVVGALQAVTQTLQGTVDSGRAALFAKSYTAKRLNEAIVLFQDKVTGAPS